MLLNFECLLLKNPNEMTKFKKKISFLMNTKIQNLNQICLNFLGSQTENKIQRERTLGIWFVWITIVDFRKCWRECLIIDRQFHPQKKKNKDKICRKSDLTNEAPPYFPLFLSLWCFLDNFSEKLSVCWLGFPFFFFGFKRERLYRNLYWNGRLRMLQE